MEVLDRRLPLVCPVCREGGIVADGADIVRCARAECGAMRPLVDGVPLLVRDWVAYLERERWTLLRRRDLPHAVDSFFSGPMEDDNAEKIRDEQLATYVRAHYGEPDSAMAELAAAFPAFVEGALERYCEGTVGVDLGCAAGGYTQRLAGCVDVACGVDLHFERARVAAEAEGGAQNVAFVVGDAHRPPLRDGSADVVLALNLIDSVHRPREALEAAERLLRPGGVMVFASPFAYSTVYSERSAWVGEEAFFGWFGERFAELERAERVSWVLPVSERRWETYFVTAVAGRKR